MRIPAVVFAACFLICCQNDCGRDIPLSDVSNARTYQLEDLASDIKVIPLIGTDSLPVIGDIHSVKGYREKLFLFDERLRKIQFFENGMYAGELNRIGRGPDEYVDIGAFAYMPTSDELVIFDRNSRKLKFYSLTSFKLTRTVALDYYISGFDYIADGRFLLIREVSSPESHDAAAVIWDADTNTEISHISITPSQDNLISDIAINRDDDGAVIFSLPGYVNRIYRVDGSGFTEISRLFFGRYGLDKKYWSGRRSDYYYVHERLTGGASVAIAPSFYLHDGDDECFWYVSGYDNGLHHLPEMSLYIKRGDDRIAVSGLRVRGVNCDIQPIGMVDGFYVSLIYPFKITGDPDAMSETGLKIHNLADYDNGNPLALMFRL